MPVNDEKLPNKEKNAPYPDEENHQSFNAENNQPLNEKNFLDNIPIELKDLSDTPIVEVMDYYSGDEININLSSLVISEKINEHATCHLEGKMNRDQFNIFGTLKDYTLMIRISNLWGAIPFFGIVTKLTYKQVDPDLSRFDINLELSSFTLMLDLEKKTDTFSYSKQTYEMLCKEKMELYKFDSIFTGFTNKFDIGLNQEIRNEQLGKFTMQYRETDWEFLKRLASRFKTGLIPSTNLIQTNILYFGVPDPDKVVPNPDKVDQDSDKVDQDPDKVDQDPDKVVPNPDKVDQDPDKVDQDPDKVDQDPDKVDQDPDKVVVMPIIELTNNNYSVSKKLAEYDITKENHIPNVSELNYTFYEVESEFDTTKIVKIGDNVHFQGKEVVIREVTLNLDFVAGKFKRKFILCTRDGLAQIPVFNDQIVGASMAGKVINVKQDKLKIQFVKNDNQYLSDSSIDHDYSLEDDRRNLEEVNSEYQSYRYSRWDANKSYNNKNYNKSFPGCNRNLPKLNRNLPKLNRNLPKWNQHLQKDNCPEEGFPYSTISASPKNTEWYMPEINDTFSSYIYSVESLPNLPKAKCPEVYFPYSTIYASPRNIGWYCMPEINDTVIIYFPSKKEEDGIAICSFMEDIDLIPKPEKNQNGNVANSAHLSIESDNLKANPKIKSLQTAYRKKIIIDPDYILIADDDMEIKLHDREGIKILAKEDIEFKAKNKIILTAENIEGHAQEWIGLGLESNKSEIEMANKTIAIKGNPTIG